MDFLPTLQKSRWRGAEVADLEDGSSSKDGISRRRDAASFHGWSFTIFSDPDCFSKSMIFRRIWANGKEMRRVDNRFFSAHKNDEIDDFIITYQSDIKASSFFHWNHISNKMQVCRFSLEREFEELLPRLKKYLAAIHKIHFKISWAFFLNKKKTSFPSLKRKLKKNSRQRQQIFYIPIFHKTMIWTQFFLLS